MRPRARRLSGSCSVRRSDWNVIVASLRTLEADGHSVRRRSDNRRIAINENAANDVTRGRKRPPRPWHHNVQRVPTGRLSPQDRMRRSPGSDTAAPICCRFSCHADSISGPTNEAQKAFRPYWELDGAPDRIRTCDPKLRRLVLYPTELRARAEGRHRPSGSTVSREVSRNSRHALSELDHQKKSPREFFPSRQGTAVFLTFSQVVATHAEA